MSIRCGGNCYYHHYISYSGVGCYLSLSSWFSRALRCPCRWTGSRGPRVPAPSPSPIRPRPSCCTTAPSRRTTTTTNPAPLRQRAPPLTTHPGPRARPPLVHDPLQASCDLKLFFSQFLCSFCSPVFINPSFAMAPRSMNTLDP